MLSSRHSKILRAVFAYLHCLYFMKFKTLVILRVRSGLAAGKKMFNVQVVELRNDFYVNGKE